MSKKLDVLQIEGLLELGEEYFDTPTPVKKNKPSGRGTGFMSDAKFKRLMSKLDIKERTHEAS